MERISATAMPLPTSFDSDTRATSPTDALNGEQARLQQLMDHPPEEIYVVSDFHLCLGRDPQTGRFSRTENFLADQAFSRFLEYAKPGPGKLLLINGDTFDFVRICHYPRTDEEFEEWSEFLGRLQIVKTPAELRRSILRVEQKFGLETDDYKSAWKLLQIANGHREFFRALATWINGGGMLLLSKGNHDLELYWPVVRRALHELLKREGADDDVVNSRLFYCDDWGRIGNIYFEHGHRYDPQQRIDDQDKSPVLPSKPSQLKLPLGIFVNRYLINQLEKLEPFLSAVRPTERILWMLLRTHPIAAVAVLFRSLRFIRRALQTSSVRDFFWYALYLGSIAIPFLTLLAIAGIFVSSRPRDFFVTKHPSSSMVLGVLGMLAPYLAAAFREFVKWLGRIKRRPAQVGEDEMARGVYATMQNIKFPTASRIYAVMGHTHDQDIQCLPDMAGATVLYLNTGTWIPVWPEDRPDLDGQVLFPFIHFSRVSPQEYRHEYLEWRDDRGKPAESYILEPAGD
jgi:UDP-2,3-diacylglucosamine pyrophosphatase LpxH